MSPLVLNLEEKTLYRAEAPMPCHLLPDRACGLWCPNLMLCYENATDVLHEGTKQKTMQLNCAQLPEPVQVVIRP